MHLFLFDNFFEMSEQGPLSFQVQIHLFYKFNVLDEEPLDREHGYSIARFRINFAAFEAEIEPTVFSKVDGLTDVEPHGEASVIGAGEGHDEFTWLLKSLIDLDLTNKKDY
jgi:hypothetical protein